MDLIGKVTVVVFAPTDLDLVIGSPSERRRFLDMTLCQVRPAYCRALSQYQRILTQIELQDYDVLRRRAATSLLTKVQEASIAVLLATLWRLGEVELSGGRKSVYEP